jgi:chloramphenicol 3-O phosphotransferase
MDQNQDIANIIFLNGTSCSGKSTLADKLELHLDEYQIVSEDNISDYREFLPLYKTPTFDDYLSGFYDYLKDLVKQGKKVIVDHVIQDSKYAKKCADLLTDYEITLIGVHCPLDILQQRQGQRSGKKGSLKFQFNEVHLGKQYDIEVDTSKFSPGQCINYILKHLQNNTVNQIHTSQKIYKNVA